MKLFLLNARYYKKEDAEKSELLGMELDINTIDADLYKPIYTLMNIRPYLMEDGGIAEDVTYVDFQDMTAKLAMPIEDFVDAYRAFAADDDKTSIWDLREACIFDDEV